MFDWLVREGGAIFSWWLLAMLAGAAVLPLLFRLAGALPSRGFALAPAAGIILIGYLYWILNILGLLRNDAGSLAFVWLIVAVISLVSYFSWQDREPILPWLRAHLPLVLTTLVLFTLLFLGWCTVRALNPSLLGTEHPMDIAFLSASRRSATFPPNDPWMAGYAISYYHFGYILMSMFANISGVSNGIAFNLAISLVFALAGIGAFSVAYDLVASRFLGRWVREGQALTVGVLACAMFLLMGNLGTAFVEVPYQTRLITKDSAYLKWLDLKYRPADLEGCPQSGSFDPATWSCGGWWWWGYSRIVNDYDTRGNDMGDVITEFPAFSFTLSDLHPHVMALPFVMLTLGLALNLLLRKRRLYPWEIGLYAVMVGSMIFLNTWDAIYIVFLIGVEALRRLINDGTGRLTRADLYGIGGMGAALLGLTALFYLPFILSFRSQAGGPLPNLLWPTQFQQFFLMFGTFIVILGFFLLVEVIRAGPTFNWRGAGETMLWTVLFGLLTVLVLAVAAWMNAEVRGAVYRELNLSDTSGSFLESLKTLLPALLGVLPRRVIGLFTEGVLLLAIFVVIGRLFSREPVSDEGTPAEARHIITYSPATGFVLLLIAAGAVLAFATDFVYLRDGFGYRINMVFKLYYQTWLLWSIASAYAVWSILAEAIPGVTGFIAGTKKKYEQSQAMMDEIPSAAASIIRPLFGVAATVVIVAGMFYPVASVISRAFADGGHLDGNANALTLDGARSLAVGSDDYATIQCFATAARSDNDVVAEAANHGIAYNNQYGRVSGLTGIPTLIGWENHEGQWRGNTFGAANTYVDEAGQTLTRVEAVKKLYEGTDWSKAVPIIKQFGITYIYVGPTERQEFGSSGGLTKFDSLKPVCSSGEVAVYSTDSIGTQAPAPAAGR
jgi:YYY domain-containing protein